MIKTTPKYKTRCNIALTKQQGKVSTNACRNCKHLWSNRATVINSHQLSVKLMKIILPSNSSQSSRVNMTLTKAELTCQVSNGNRRKNAVSMSLLPTKVRAASRKWGMLAIHGRCHRLLVLTKRSSLGRWNFNAMRRCNPNHVKLKLKWLTA